jgi:hypothetical protein
MDSGSGYSNFKEKRIRDKKHLAFVRTLPCIRCFQAPSQAAHVRLGSICGTGLKPSDSKILPMCAAHHFESHNVGEKTFHGDMDKVHELTGYLYEHTGNWKICVLRIREYISLNQKAT